MSNEIASDILSRICYHLCKDLDYKPTQDAARAAISELNTIRLRLIQEDFAIILENQKFINSL